MYKHDYKPNFVPVPGKPMHDMIVIHVESAGFYAGNYARIFVNAEQVEMSPNENETFRGIHIVIINPYNGLVESA